MITLRLTLGPLVLVDLVLFGLDRATEEAEEPAAPAVATAFGFTADLADPPPPPTADPYFYAPDE